MKSKLLLVAGVIFVFLSASLFGLYEYATHPRFCRSCHYMTPYYESWQSSSHRQVGCLDCHFEPGALNELRGKWRALSQFTSYITQTYTSKPYAEVSDRSCLQEGCHSTRLLKGKQTFKRGIRFDHRPHLLEMRHGMKLRCTSCHSQIVIGKHVEVTESTCFLCHFQAKDPAMRDCSLCHGPPAEVIPVAGMEIRHSNLVQRGIPCTRCHANVVSGRGEVARERCFDCHNQPQKIEKFDQVELIHINHVSLHRIECERCHSPIRHRFDLHLARQQHEDCAGCHKTVHNPQQALYWGRGGRGVETMPDPMSQIGMGCTACHVVPQNDPLEEAFFGQTFTSNVLPCYACHGKRYEEFLRLLSQRLEEMSSPMEKELARKRSLLASPPPGLGEVEGLRLQTLLRDAAFNLRFVKAAKGVHNPSYAIELLRAGRGFLDEADRLLGGKGAKGPLPVGFTEKNCRDICHKALPEPEVIPLGGGKSFPHRLHLDKSSDPCIDCHPGKSHPHRTQMELKNCSACHHREERGKEEACPRCHSLQRSFSLGKVDWPLGEEIEADNEMEDVECTECHDLASRRLPREAIRESCVSCHDEDNKDYGEEMDRWIKKYGGRLSALSMQLGRIEAKAAAIGQKERVQRLTTTLELLQKANPLHNVALADKVIEAVEKKAKEIEENQ